MSTPSGDHLSDDLRRIQGVQAAYRFDQQTTVLTSKDEVATAMMNGLAAANLAAEFRGLLIPIVFGPGTEAVVEAPGGKTTGAHHHESNGFHLIRQGKVRFTGQDKNVVLEPGDWVYIPAGVDYNFDVLEDVILYYRHPGPPPPVPPVPPGPWPWPWHWRWPWQRP